MSHITILKICFTYFLSFIYIYIYIYVYLLNNNVVALHIDHVSIYSMFLFFWGPKMTPRWPQDDSKMTPRCIQDDQTLFNSQSWLQTVAIFAQVFRHQKGHFGAGGRGRAKLKSGTLKCSRNRMGLTQGLYMPRKQTHELLKARNTAIQTITKLAPEKHVHTHRPYCENHFLKPTTKYTHNDELARPGFAIDFNSIDIFRTQTAIDRRPLSNSCAQQLTSNNLIYAP
jgi:hypothetical protein